MKERIKVRIISPSTRILSFQTENNKKLLELKNEVILELSDDMASMPIFAPDSRVLGPRFRLVKADYEGYEMNEQQTLAQLNIRHNDILVLVFKRNGLQQMVTQTRETRPPLEADIENATRHVVDVQNPLPLIDLNEIFQQSNVSPRKSLNLGTGQEKAFYCSKSVLLCVLTTPSDTQFFNFSRLLISEISILSLS